MSVTLELRTYIIISRTCVHVVRTTVVNNSIICVTSECTLAKVKDSQGQELCVLDIKIKTKPGDEISMCTFSNLNKFLRAGVRPPKLPNIRNIPKSEASKNTLVLPHGQGELERKR